MDKRVAIVTDSTAYIPAEVRKQLNIHMVPLSVIFGDESYEEEVTISADEFYKKMSETEQLPTTSQPPVGHFVDVFLKLSEKGYDQIISIHLSSKISGTYQCAISAGEMVEGIEVFAFDSEISCAPQGYFACEAAKLAEKGTGAETILFHLGKMKTRMDAYFMVDDLKHLYRGGRLGSGQLVVGQLLKIKPLLHFNDGVIVPFEKVRTEKKALGRILQLLEQDIQKGGRFIVTVIHAMNEEKAKELAQVIRDQFTQVEVNLSYFGPVIGTHLGRGSLGVGWYQVTQDS